MPVPTLITDLSTTIASNSPLGSESPASLDDYQRAQAAFIAQLYANTVASTTIIVASAATTAIGAAASENVDISGTTTITSFGTVAEGINRKGRFTGALILTHNATSLILPGVANITTAANDSYEARSLGAGNWIVTKYAYASGNVRLTGNETIAGVKTFTTATPIILSGTGPFIQGRNTGIALPNGLWRTNLASSSDAMHFQKNTAAASDFSTVLNVLFFTATQATFAVPVAVSDAVAAGDAVNKGQLDAKVYGGRVTGGVTPTIVYGPTGWTMTNPGGGQYVITHNLGTTNYSVSLTLINGTSIQAGVINTNNFTVYTYNSTPALSNFDFNFVVARN